MSWSDALGWTAGRFREIIERHGPDAVAFYGSGQLDTESVYTAVKLFKGSIGTNNTDSNSRLCMAAAVAGYRTSLGADGPPPCYADINLSTCIVAWGSNMAEAHPVTFDRVKAHLKANPGVELIVVDPRRTNTADQATLYVPVAPGGDIPLMNAVGRIVIERRVVDQAFVEAHTEGYKAYRDFLLETDWSAMVAATGVPEAMVYALADKIGRARAMLTFYCQGLNQSTVGMWKNNSIINLHLLTGQIGKPGAGPFSLTGQPNAMGGREAGMLAQALPGIGSSKTRAPRRGRGLLGTRAGTISSRPGLTAVEMFRALEIGPAQGHLDRGDQPCGQPSRPALGPQGAGQGRTDRRARSLSSDRDDQVGRRFAPHGAMVREDIHQHRQCAAGLVQRANREPPGHGFDRLGDPGQVWRGDGLPGLQVQGLE